MNILFLLGMLSVCNLCFIVSLLYCAVAYQYKRYIRVLLCCVKFLKQESGLELTAL